MILWYVLHCRMGTESLLWRELVARGLDGYYPTMDVRAANQRSSAARPYFPGYVFVHVDLEKSGLSTLEWMSFSLGFVSFGGHPAIVPDAFVHALQGHVEKINGSRGSSTDDDSTDSSTGYESIFDAALSDDDRVLVFLKLLQRRQLPLDLPQDRSQGKEND